MDVTNTPHGRVQVEIPADESEGVALLALYGPRCGFKGASLLSLPAAQKLIGDLQERVDSETVRRLSAGADALLSS